MAKRSRKLSTRRPRRSKSSSRKTMKRTKQTKSSSHKTMKRTKRTKRQSSRKHTSKKHKSRKKNKKRKKTKRVMMGGSYPTVDSLFELSLDKAIIETLLKEQSLTQHVTNYYLGIVLEPKEIPKPYLEQINELSGMNIENVFNLIEIAGYDKSQQYVIVVASKKKGMFASSSTTIYLIDIQTYEHGNIKEIGKNLQYRDLKGLIEKHMTPWLISRTDKKIKIIEPSKVLELLKQNTKKPLKTVELGSKEARNLSREHLQQSSSSKGTNSELSKLIIIEDSILNYEDKRKHPDKRGSKYLKTILNNYFHNERENTLLNGLNMEMLTTIKSMFNTTTQQDKAATQTEKDQGQENANTKFAAKINKTEISKNPTHFVVFDFDKCLVIKHQNSELNYCKVQLLNMGFPSTEIETQASEASIVSDNIFYDRYSESHIRDIFGNPDIREFLTTLIETDDIQVVIASFGYNEVIKYVLKRLLGEPLANKIIIITGEDYIERMGGKEPSRWGFSDILTKFILVKSLVDIYEKQEPKKIIFFDDNQLNINTFPKKGIDVKTSYKYTPILAKPFKKEHEVYVYNHTSDTYPTLSQDVARAVETKPKQPITTMQGSPPLPPLPLKIANKLSSPLLPPLPQKIEMLLSP